MAAMGAAGCGCCKAYIRLFTGVRIFCFKKFMALPPPFMFQHQRQAIYDNVQEAAYTKAE
jgi:hypothetical protein